MTRRRYRAGGFADQPRLYHGPLDFRFTSPCLVKGVAKDIYPFYTPVCDAELKGRDTHDNLKSAMASETYEYTDMYPGMAKAARAEGFK